MKIKKIYLLLIVCMLCLSTACNSNSSSSESGKDTDSSITNTISDSKNVIENNTEPEPTAEIEPETKKYYEETVYITKIEDYSFLLDYKDVIVSYFDNKVLAPNEVINVKDEIINAGYSLEEYGKVFGTIYYEIYVSPKYYFKVIEHNEMDNLYYPLINDSNNFVYQVTDEDPITINIEFADNGNMILKLTTY